jgi:hypothetical protein
MDVVGQLLWEWTKKRGIFGPELVATQTLVAVAQKAFLSGRRRSRYISGGLRLEGEEIRPQA